MSRARKRGRKRHERSRRRAADKPEFDLGLLIVHGIGRQARGDTLRAFVEPLTTFVADGLAVSADAVGIFERVGDDRPSGRRHCVELQFSGLDGGRAVPVRQRWLATECYWDDVVATDDLQSLWLWLVRVFPWLLMWQVRSSVTAGLVARFTSGGRWLNPLTWFAFFCNLFWSLMVRAVVSTVFLAAAVAFTPALVVSAVSRTERLPRLARALTNVMFATLGDAEAFVSRPDVAAAMQARFAEDFGWLRQQARSVVVVAHSQGAALTYQALRASPPESLASLQGVFCMGSGLGPLSGAAAPSRSFALSMATLMIALPGFVALPTALIPVAVLAALSVVAITALIATLALLPLGVLVAPREAARGIADIVQGLAGRYGDGLAQNADLLTVAVVLAVPAFAVTLRAERRRRLIPPVPRDRWIEYCSPLDPVSLGTRPGEHATFVRVVNLRGLQVFREHTSYFANDRELLPDLCERLSGWMSIALPGRADATPIPRESRTVTRLVLAAPSILTIFGFLVGRLLRLW